jgi:hypothetical protein
MRLTRRHQHRLSFGAIFRQTLGIDPHCRDIGMPFQQC